jgi:L-fuconolactonase
MPDFPIIDAHVHLYDPGAVRYDWMKSVPLLNSPHLISDFDRAIGNCVVEGAIFVEVDAAAGHHLNEARWVAAMMQREPRVQGMVAAVPLENGSNVEADLASLSRLPGVRGVRRLIQGHANEGGWCLRDDFVNAVQLLPQYGFSFDLCIVHNQLSDAIELCRRCPGVNFVLDHIGKPGIKAGLMEPWASELKLLAGLANVSCKISGVVTEADHKSWTGDEVLPYVKHAISCFGFERVMFGGDWPVLELAGHYEAWVAIVDSAIAGETAGNKRKLYRDNAIRFYRLES